MDTNQWPQAIGLVKPIHQESSLPKQSGAGASAPPVAAERKPRPQKEQALNCPRCNSTNTKFCYYNNYSLTQPRYFCKTCRRYWTEGGTLRSVPVGGGSRKNKRSSPALGPAMIPSSSTSPYPSSAVPPSALKKAAAPSDLATQITSFPHHQNPNLSGFIHLPYNNENHHDPSSNNNKLFSGICPKSLSSLMSMPISVSNSGFFSSVLPVQDGYNKPPKLNFCLDGFGDDHHDDRQNGYGNGISSANSASARLFLPYEDLKPISMNRNVEQYEPQQQQNRGDQEGGESNGYWPW